MRLKVLIETKESEIDTLLKKIEDYNKDLEHTKALIELAKFLKNKKIERVLSHVDDIHQELGNNRKDIQTLRMFQSDLRTTLRKEFEKKYGREASNKLEDII